MTRFEAWIALAFPWLLPTGPDYRNLRHAWEAGVEAAKCRQRQQEGGYTPESGLYEGKVAKAQQWHSVSKFKGSAAKGGS